mmetsp:Transcript_19045/g.34347  ORF Transcript_19045/g.34347 Transcript_19045/m.34347 type:complete len:199 (+) Transcript_19045:153-749(+)
MSKSGVRLFVIMMIGVVASSSVSNLMSVRSSSQETRIQHAHPHNDSCVDENSIHPGATFCLRESMEFDIDDDGCVDTTASHGTAGAESLSPQERKYSSWSNLALMCLLWHLSFANLELHQLALFISFLFIAGCFENTMVIISFFGVGLLKLLAIFRGSKIQRWDTSDDLTYYNEEAEVSFSVDLGSFTWTVRCFRNDF